MTTEVTSEPATFDILDLASTKRDMPPRLMQYRAARRGKDQGGKITVRFGMAHRVWSNTDGVFILLHFADESRHWVPLGQLKDGYAPIPKEAAAVVGKPDGWAPKPQKTAK
jgi:hypothetical protein